MQTFEKYLEEVCHSYTNNSPEGFERWMENLDVQEVIDYAERWGKIQILEAQIQTLKEIRENLNK
jgi:hypothetical protein